MGARVDRLLLASAVFVLHIVALPGTCAEVGAEDRLSPQEAIRVVVEGSGQTEEAPATPAAKAWQVGDNDFRISDMGGTGSSLYSVSTPAVAYNSIDDEYLVVWAGMDNVGGVVDGEVEIYGQIVSSAGVPVGVNDFRISDVAGIGTTSGFVQSPDVAFNPVYGEYLVVWQADDPVDGVVAGESEIWGQLLDADGNQIFVNDFRISDVGGSGDTSYVAQIPAVACNTTLGEYLVVWFGDDNTGGLVDNEYEVFGQLLSDTGLEFGVNDFRISNMGTNDLTSYGASRPDVVFNSTDNEWLVVWSGDDDTPPLVDGESEIWGQLLGYWGTAIGGDTRLSDVGGLGNPNYDASAPVVAYNSLRNEYLVAWRGDDSVGGLVDDEMEIFVQRLNEDLGGLGPNDYRITDLGGIGNTNYGASYGPPAIDYDPVADQYLVCWSGTDNVGGLVQNETEVFCQALAFDLTEIGPNDQRISDAHGIGNTDGWAVVPGLAAGRDIGEFLAIWIAVDDLPGMAENESEIFGQRLQSLGLFIDGFETGDTGSWSVATGT